MVNKDGYCKRRRLLDSGNVNVVRATEHECDPSELSDARPVQAVCRRGLCDRAMPCPSAVRPPHLRVRSSVFVVCPRTVPPHLRVLRRGNAGEDDGDGSDRQEGVPGRDLEPT